MNSLQKSTSVCKIKAFFNKLFQLQLKSDYNIKVSVYRDGDSTEPSSTHSMSGTCKCRIIKIAAVLCAVWLMMCAMCSLCSCIRK